MEKREELRLKDPITLLSELITKVAEDIERLAKNLDTAVNPPPLPLPLPEHRETPQQEKTGEVPSPSYPGQTPVDYCLECLTRHYLKALGLLEEAERFSINKGYITPEARKRIELALKEVVTAEEDLGVRAEDPEVAKILDEIKAGQRAWRKKLWAYRLLTTETSIEKLREIVREMESMVELVRKAGEVYHSKYGLCKACEKLAVEVAEKYGVSVGEVRETLYDLASDNTERIKKATEKLKSIGALEYVKKRVEEVLHGWKEGGKA